MRLVVITSHEKDLDRNHEDVAAAAIKGGCRAIQFRSKNMTDRAFIETARRIQIICYQAGALFFVNDRVHVAAALDCEVHLGFNDLSVALTRKVTGPGTIIGYSPESVGEAREAVDAGADYLGVGSVFHTESKTDAGAPIGLDGLERICKADLAPVIGVGGVDFENASSVAAAGAKGIAVITAVTRAPDMKEATEALLEAFAKGTQEEA
jgi:thiamine-phosphate pyrophosphorylase